MRTKLFSLLFICCVFTVKLYAQTNLALIPYPKHVLMNAGEIDLSRGVNLMGPKGLKVIGDQILKEKAKWQMKKNGVPIHMSIEDIGNNNPESYKLVISAAGIQIQAGQEAGLFYGLQTVAQLGIQYGKKLPQIQIEDAPRFAWRAYLLDEARYFQGKKAVFKLLDDMALLKMNTFHWHLTDDAGWRVEIKKYPLLTQIGGTRDSSQIDDQGKKWNSDKSDGKVHQGFYTQEDIKEIVAYAKARHITIVPEFNMPGHASAAVASYPWLGTSKEQIKVPTRFGVVTTVFDVSSPQVIGFFHDVLKELSELFPGQVIHIGGDEVKYKQWEESPAINAYMKEHHLPAYSDLQVYITNNISNYIEQKLHRRMMGWNEILGTKTHDYQNTQNATTQLSKTAVIHFWKGSAADFTNALDKGYQIVNSTHSNTYLDYSYTSISLDKAYHFDPVPEGVDASKSKNIIGLGCQMWGEWTPTFKEVTYQTFPRIAAFAETGWSSKTSKDYNRFKKNLEPLYQYWLAEGYVLPDKGTLGL